MRGAAMEQVTFDKAVGFILAALFALVIGVSMWALLVGDYMHGVMTEQAQRSLRIVGFAGALAALATWWVQGFAAHRGPVVRLLFSLFMCGVVVSSIGGMQRAIYG